MAKEINKSIITVEINGKSLVFPSVKAAVEFWQMLGRHRVKELNREWGYEGSENEEFHYLQPITISMVEKKLDLFSTPEEAKTAKANWETVIKRKLKDKS